MGDVTSVGPKEATSCPKTRNRTHSHPRWAGGIIKRASNQWEGWTDFEMIEPESW
jgi:hypothetical protein